MRMDRPGAGSGKAFENYMKTARNSATAVLFLASLGGAAAFGQSAAVSGRVIDASGAVVRQAEVTLQQDRLALLTAVRQQFYVALAAQRRVEVQENLLKVLLAALDTAKRLQKVGEASQIDYLLLSVDYRQVEMYLRRGLALREARTWAEPRVAARHGRRATRPLSTRRARRRRRPA